MRCGRELELGVVADEAWCRWCGRGWTRLENVTEVDNGEARFGLYVGRGDRLEPYRPLSERELRDALALIEALNRQIRTEEDRLNDQSGSMALFCAFVFSISLFFVALYSGVGEMLAESMVTSRAEQERNVLDAKADGELDWARVVEGSPFSLFEGSWHDGVGGVIVPWSFVRWGVLVTLFLLVYRIALAKLRPGEWSRTECIDRVGSLDGRRCRVEQQVFDQLRSIVLNVGRR